jgi:hypothetical protein
LPSRVIEAGVVNVSPALFRASEEYDDEPGGRPVTEIGW